MYLPVHYAFESKRGFKFWNNFSNSMHFCTNERIQTGGAVSDAVSDFTSNQSHGKRSNLMIYLRTDSLFQCQLRG